MIPAHFLDATGRPIRPGTIVLWIPDISRIVARVYATSFTPGTGERTIEMYALGTCQRLSFTTNDRTLTNVWKLSEVALDYDNDCSLGREV
jgi:hypothetical protein